jgi:TolA-binding protein
MKLLFAVFLCGTIASEPAAAERITEAAQPITEGVPQVAVVRLRALLAGKLPDDERALATLRLGEALVASAQFAEALQVLDASPVKDTANGQVLRAQALAGSIRWAEARPRYQTVAGESGTPFASDAVYGAGETLRALGRVDEALRIFASLDGDERWRTRAHSRMAELFLAKGDPEAARGALDAVEATSPVDRQERRVLRGCIELQLGEHERAARLFASALKIGKGTHSAMVAALFGRGDTHLQAGTPGAGDDFLEDYVERHPSDPELPVIFAKLDQLYAAERKQSRHELGRWSRDPAQPRAALAQWYLARAELRLGRKDNALRSFERLSATPVRLPALTQAFVEHSDLLLAESRYDDALAALQRARDLQPPPELRQRIDLLAGRAEYAAQRFAVAGRTFTHVANSSGPKASDALFNATLAWLSAGDAAQAASARDAFTQGGADEASRGELDLEGALLQARRGEQNAAQSLQSFVRDHPKHTRVSEAWVALAELAFHASPPRLADAQQNLRRAMESEPTAAAQERADYLNIWIEEAAGAPNDTKVIELASAFLQKFAGSAFAADVRLKLAETYYRRQDFASAQTQFVLLAREDPRAPIAEKALFFAAQSARETMGPESIDSALKLFDEVVRRNGELKWAARNEQAVIERKLAKPNDALTLYDEVLKGDARPAEKREALCGKADILYELGAADSANYKRAVELYEQLATQSDVASHWRNQALFKKGMCLEKLNARDEALATFYQIVEDGSRPDRRREFFWFYKAGFNAARLLEEQSNWKPAAAIYEKLAFAGGPRSEEAKSRLDRLRLEQFLWD